MIRITTIVSYYIEPLVNEQQLTALVLDVICTNANVHFAMIQSGSLGVLVVKFLPHTYQVTIDGFTMFLDNADQFCSFLWDTLRPPTIYEPKFNLN